MRQLHVLVRRERVPLVLDLASEHQAFSPAAADVVRRIGDGEGEGDWSLIFLNLPNDRVGNFIWEVREEVEDAHFTLYPDGALPIQTPLSEVHERVRSVAHRSTLELVLDSLQSIGSWKGMLLYSLYSGVVAAYGLIVDASFLLVAAMLIAPMGAPAMVAVIGIALGDLRMFGRGALRFFVAIAVLVLSAIGVGLGYRLHASTAMMEQVTSLSMWGVLLALVAGAAGAQSQVESRRSSLVTGTATGFLIAAALSPTSAVLGLAIVLRRWSYAELMAFQLLLQFAAIGTGGWLSLLIYRVHPSDPSAERGSSRVRAMLAAGMGLAVLALVVWQYSQNASYRKADLSYDAASLADSAVASISDVRLVEASAHFTRRDLPTREEALLMRLVVERLPGAAPASEVEEAVREAMKREIQSHLQGVLPFVDVSVLPGPTDPAEGGAP